MARVIDCKNNIYPMEFNVAARSITEGNVVIFPTETVYGIGADALNEEAVAKIFKAKGRQSDNPLIVHICDFEMLNVVAENFGYTEMQLANQFWPGPLTIIFNKTKSVPYNVTAGLDTVAVRMPSNPVATKLIRDSRCPIAAPSANVSGKPSGTKVSDIIEELGDSVAYVIDSGDTAIGVESTVVKIKNDKVVILRPGKVTVEDIKECGFEVEIDEHIFQDVKKNEIVESPGMKHRHYAPKTKCVMVTGESEEEKIDKINSFIKRHGDKKVCVIGFKENEANITANDYISYGSISDLDEVAHNIFSILREVDRREADIVLIEEVSLDGIGLAIYNRLIRACEYTRK